MSDFLKELRDFKQNIRKQTESNYQENSNQKSQLVSHQYQNPYFSGQKRTQERSPIRGGRQSTSFIQKSTNKGFSINNTSGYKDSGNVYLKKFSSFKVSNIFENKINTGAFQNYNFSRFNDKKLWDDKEKSSFKEPQVQQLQRFTDKQAPLTSFQSIQEKLQEKLKASGSSLLSKNEPQTLFENKKYSFSKENKENEFVKQFSKNPVRIMTNSIIKQGSSHQQSIQSQSLQEKLPFIQIQKFEDVLIDSGEYEFNQLPVQYVEELVKLSSVIMYKIKNSKFYSKVL